MAGRILVVDDERSMCEMLETALELRGFEVAWRTGAEEALELLGRRDFDTVLSDLRMPRMSGTELCERVAASRPDIPVVVMTGFGSMESAVAAIRAGAYDFVTKPIELDVLGISLERAVKHRRLQQQVQRLSDAVEKAGRFDEMLGTSAAIQSLFEQLRRIAPSEASVLICGESGTGKELVARSIHNNSRRREGPFVAVNCAALPESLLESELFGHAKGAFTDARHERKGLFQQAQHGTLLLDEVGELPLTTQPKLLRALEEGRVRPVGSDQEVQVDVRLVASTNRDLETAVEESRFRQDLFFRINVIQIELPPLRSRGTDVLLLAQHFIEKFAARSEKNIVGLTEQTLERLLNYSWPGNIRELRNVMERAVALTQYDRIVVDDLPEKVRNYQSSQVFVGGDDPSELVPLEEVEARYIQHVLRAVDGNKTMAARILGLDRKTLYRKLKQSTSSLP